MHRHWLGAACLLAAGTVSAAGGLPTEGQVLHLDAATLTQEGEKLSRWEDLSGNDNHLSQTEVDKQPVVAAKALNGLSVVKLTGKTSLEGPAPLAEGDCTFTFIAVWRRDSGKTAEAVCEQASPGEGRRASLLTVNDRYGFNGQSNDQHRLLSFRRGEWNLSVLTLGDNGRVRLWHNDSHGGTGACGLIDAKRQNTGADLFRLGGKATTGGELLTGAIAEVVVYDRVLTEAEVVAVNEHLAAKWGIGKRDKDGKKRVTTMTIEEMDKGPDRTSAVPQFTFSTTLAEQEAELAANPLRARFATSRAELAADPYRPLYHYVSPESTMNDPNGLCFWQGRWHLFYQAYPPEDRRQHWGHAVSDDLIHWRDLPYALYPNPEDKCFSGAAFVDGDRVIAAYHGTEAGTMVAVSSDPLLLNWEKVTGQPVIPFPKPGEPPVPYNIFDPCIWKQGDYYYILTAGTLPDGPGGKRVRAEFLHRSTDLAKWEYLHPFLEDDAYGLVGDDGACPYFWPLGDQHLLLHYSHMSGGKYLLGDYDVERQKFVVTHGGDFNFGASNPGGVHAPSACPDGEGGLILIFNMNPAKPTQGWNQIMSLPRRLTLLGRDELGQEPAGDFSSLRGKHTALQQTVLPANQELVVDGIRGKSLEIVAEIETKGAPLLELNVLRSPNREEFTRLAFYRDRGYDRGRRGLSKGRDSVIVLDNSRSSTLPDVQSRPPEVAPVLLAPGEPLKLHVFVDRSIVEAFVNGKQCVAARVYPGRDDSLGVSLRAQGRDALLKSLDAWEMGSAYR